MSKSDCSKCVPYVCSGLLWHKQVAGEIKRIIMSRLLLPKADWHQKDYSYLKWISFYKSMLMWLREILSNAMYDYGCWRKFDDRTQYYASGTLCSGSIIRIGHIDSLHKSAIAIADLWPKPVDLSVSQNYFEFSISWT